MKILVELNMHTYLDIIDNDRPEAPESKVYHARWGRFHAVSRKSELDAALKLKEMIQEASA